MAPLSSQRTWLVTGSAGFIGSHLIEHLLRLHRLASGLAESLSWYVNRFAGASA